MFFNNCNAKCPRCQKIRSAHTLAERKKCSAWNKTNLRPAQTSHRKAHSKPTANSINDFSRFINRLDAGGRRED